MSARSVGSQIVGSVLGKYRIVAELSVGGMGEVYRAQHEILGKAAAVKVLRAGLSGNTELVTRFVHEAKAASAIQHPGIIEIFDFGTTDDDRAYLVMEFLDGDVLSKRLARRGRLTDREAVEIGRGIASALAAAHAKGIVHRDLKPDNVFLVPDPDTPSRERPKIFDFGIAKLVDHAPTETRHTRTGALMGTPLYMAPEQARAAGSIDHRADLYSLGCILYELVVGEPPFVGAGAGEIITMHMFEAPSPPSRRVPVAPGLERLILRLLAKEPGDRYQSATQLVDALATVLAPDEPPARRPPPREETHPTRGSLLPIVAAIVTLGIVGTAVAVLARSGGDTKPTAVRPTAPAHRVAPRDPPIREETAPTRRPATQAGSQSSLPVTKRGSSSEVTP